MDFSSPELTLAIAAAAGALTANAGRWLFRLFGNFVRGTPNKLDDRIYDAVTSAIARSAVEVKSTADPR